MDQKIYNCELTMTSKKSALLLILLIYPFFFIGCDYKERLKNQLKKIVPEETNKFARTYIDILRKGDIEKAEELLDPQVVNSRTQSDLQQCFDYLNKGEPIAIELVGVNIRRINGIKRYYLSYQLQFQNTLLLANFTVVEMSGNNQIFSYRVSTLSKSLEEINAFTFSGKSFRHYIVLLVAAGTPIFIIYTIVLCVRTKMKRKWLWIIFMLFGVGNYSLYWTSGNMVFQPFTIMLFSAGFSKSGFYGPWIFTISVPIGALVFILMRRKIKKSESVDVSVTLESNDEATREIDS
jgi:hypothetical protein